MEQAAEVSIGKAKTNRWKVSPTQVRAFMECPRKWGYRYLDNVETPQTKAAAFGSETHGVLEAIALGTVTEDQLKTRAGRLASVGLPHLPLATWDPKRVDEAGKLMQLVEAEVNFVWEGVHYRGFVDLMWWDDEQNRPVVSDHKTSSDPQQWGLTEKQLPKDPQALIYSVFGLEWYGSDVVGLQWTYFRTKGKPLAFPVRNALTREKAHENFKSIVSPVGLAIYKAVRECDEAKQLPANPDACGMYGGCPHAAYCPRSRDERRTAALGPKHKDENKTMGLKDRLKNKRKAPTNDARTDAIIAKHEKAMGLSNVVDMPGRTVNSPEAPANPEVAREVSRAVGTITGKGDKAKTEQRSVANAAAGAETTEEAADAIENRTSEPNITWMKEDERPKDWDPTKTPKQEQILAWVTTGTFHKFCPVRAKASTETPFAHGRTLSVMEKNGLIEVVPIEGGLRHVSLKEDAIKKFQALDAPEVWAQRKPERQTILVDESGKELKTRDEISDCANKAFDQQFGRSLAVEVDDEMAAIEPTGPEVVLVIKRIDGKVHFIVDPSLIKGLV